MKILLSFLFLLIMRREIIFYIDALGASSPDGFISRFYRHCWDNVGQDIVLTVQEFFRVGYVFSEMNSNFIVLVSKTPTALTVD